MPIVIGLDLGTTHAKAIALEQDGRVTATASRGYPMYTPQPGRAEQDPQAVWQGAAEALHELAGQLNAEDIAGLCLSGAMHSSLPVAADGTPLAPALTWADQRASALARQLRTQTDTHALYQRTGCPLQPIYHIAKLRWWVEMAPEINQPHSILRHPQRLCTVLSHRHVAGGYQRLLRYRFTRYSPLHLG